MPGVRSIPPGWPNWGLEICGAASIIRRLQTPFLEFIGYGREGLVQFEGIGIADLMKVIYDFGKTIA